MKVPPGSKTELVSKFLNLVTKRENSMNVNKGMTAEHGIHQPSGRLDWNGHISDTV